MAKAFANLNEMWSSVLVETLRRKGVSTAVICPGSRSSPLTFAFARESAIEAIPVLDERSAGFFALGIAKRSGRPVALLCTSGSAVANFFPSVVEASESGAPLIVLTADRPAELRDCSAGQTIDQVKFFSGYVRHQLELSSPEASLHQLRYLRQAISHACDVSLAADTGPVHINAPFRDPLVPVPDAAFELPFSQKSFEAFFANLDRDPTVHYPSAELPNDWLTCEKGLLLVGPQSPVKEAKWAENFAAFANRLGWPVLADALNPIRSRAHLFENLICGYEFIVRNKELREALSPERAIVIGTWPTSKSLRQWIGEGDVPLIVLATRLINADPTHSRTRTLRFDFAEDSPELAGRTTGGYANKWRDLELATQNVLTPRLEDHLALFEGKLAWHLSRTLPKRSALCVSNSMPPRDMEFYFSANEKEISVYSSRGANGIDGILSTALGVAHQAKPTYLVIGDLALLHDTNGALLARQFEGSLTILLINNGGGGIFEMLPVAQFDDVFEKHFVTDQRIDFSNWARTYGIQHQRVENWNELDDLIQSQPQGIRILELPTNRKEDAALRKRWFAEVSQHLPE